MAASEAGVRQRLTAYILPRSPQTSEQQQAFDAAVRAQLEFENAAGLGDLPANVKSVSIGDYSVTLGEDGANVPPYTRETVSPVAWAYLRNAGLIAYVLPTARRL